MPIGSPAPSTDFSKQKTGGGSPSNFSVVGHQHVIRPELVRPTLGPPQSLPNASNTTSVIRISPASSSTHQILRPVIVDPTKLIPVFPNSDLAKNGISTGSVYQWHSLLPVIKPSPNTYAFNSNNNNNKNESMASPIVQFSPVKIQTIKNGIVNLNEPGESNILLNSNNELYDNDDDAGDDDVFEAEPVKSIQTSNKDTSMKHPSVSQFQQDNFYGYKHENVESKDDPSTSNDVASAYNKRRTQSCSALQANQGSVLKVILYCLFFSSL